jgi:hypothetical protein
MITKVSRNDYYRIQNCFTQEEIRLKYGRLEIADKNKNEMR